MLCAAAFPPGAPAAARPVRGQHGVGWFGCSRPWERKAGPV